MPCVPQPALMTCLVICSLCGTQGTLLSRDVPPLLFIWRSKAGWRLDAMNLSTTSSPVTVARFDDAHGLEACRFSRSGLEASPGATKQHTHLSWALSFSAGCCSSGSPSPALSAPPSFAFLRSRPPGRLFLQRHT